MAAKASEAATSDIRSHPAAPRRTLLWTLLVASVLLLIGLVAGSVWVYRALYSPSAFVTHYLTLLHEGRAADALQLPGVNLTPEMVESSELNSNASPALLRHAALAPLNDIVITDEHREGDEYVVTASYTANKHEGSTQFRVKSDGFKVLAPQWQFSESPLAQLDVRIFGSEQFRINNFDLDRLQIDPSGDPDAPMQLLVFSPGMYVISVQTQIAQTKNGGVGFFSNVPLKATAVDVQLEPTAEFTQTIQERLDTVLDECVTKRVLMPANCPFGRVTSDILDPDEPPLWSVVAYPKVELEPRGNDWIIKPTQGAVHLYAPVRLLHDGTDTVIDEDVPFEWAGIVQILPDGTAAIRLGSPTEFGF